MFCEFDTYTDGHLSMQEKRRQPGTHCHNSTMREVATADGIHIRYYNLICSEPGTIIIENDRPAIQLSYTLSGNKRYLVRDSHYQLASIKKQEYNYMYLTPGQVCVCWDAAEQVELFELSIKPELMLPFLSNEHPLYARLQQSIMGEKSVSISDFNLFLSAQSTSILYEMLYCPLDGRYKELYIKSKLDELLVLELEAYDQLIKIAPVQYSKRSRLTQADVKRMYQVRAIILSDVKKTSSLIELAHEVGTNDTYLKRYFKEVFGTTVYGFQQAVKMKIAKEKLLEGYNVSETATRIGYKHAAHFTRAFKKYFGVNPNQVKSHL